MRSLACERRVLKWQLVDNMCWCSNKVDQAPQDSSFDQDCHSADKETVIQTSLMVKLRSQDNRVHAEEKIISKGIQLGLGCAGT